MKAVVMDTAEDSLSQASDEQLVSLQIYVPELIVQKCMQFNREELIWDVKNQILAALPKELKEGFNYGLFCPPVNGRAGKFLDEERPLADYPFTDNSAYVELRYKRRIYKINMEEKQLKQLHSRANLRRLIDHIHNNNVEKITKMCSRGLDPNFHCQETGESPLTLTTTLKHPAKVIMALVNGGAHLDFRNKDGATVLHKAVEKNNLEALRTLLDLGSSPNYKDMRGLTTLYYSVLYNSNPQLTEMLLHDHAATGTADPHGWQEVHQACKYGLVQHLEHLLFYGADMNARNASGNTPLHVCAVNDQESCARVLLFRGADKNALNYANQNPHQVAVIAGNLRLAEIIKNHKPEDVVPFREAPRYNPRRRTSGAMGGGGHNHSDPRLDQLPPQSPSPSDHDEEQQLNNHSAAEAVDGSGAGANSSGTDSDPFDSAKSTPLTESICVCVEEYNPSTSGHLQLAKGDLIQILAVSGSGYLEGRRRDGEEGLFPAACIQEMTIRCADTLPAAGRVRADARRNLNARSSDYARKWKTFGEPRTVILHKGKKGFGFILRGAKATSPLMERQPTEFWPSLQYLDDVDKGGVAEMAGLKKGDFLLEINGQDVSQASHERVVAIIRQSGDLVSMTVVTVIQAQPLANRQCATLPRKLSAKKAPLPPKRDPKTTLSVGRARARSMVAGLAEIDRSEDHALNEYDSEGRSTKSSSVESIPAKPPAAPRQAPRQASATELEDFCARHLPARGQHPPPRNRYATAARIHKARRRGRHRAKEDHPDFRIPKNYSSTPELCSWEPLAVLAKRSRSLGDLQARRYTASKSRRSKIHSLPDAAHGEKTPPDGPSLIKQNGSDIYAETVPVAVKSGGQRASCPPPSYPPPPPPVGQVVKVDVSRGEYADLTPSRQHKPTAPAAAAPTAVMSSFRPTDSAKLYASPDAFVTSVGYKKENNSSSRSQSLPPKMPPQDSSSGEYAPFAPSREHSGATLRKKGKASLSEAASPKQDTSEEEEDNPPSEAAKLVTFKAPDEAKPNPNNNDNPTVISNTNNVTPPNSNTNNVVNPTAINNANVVSNPAANVNTNNVVCNPNNIIGNPSPPVSHPANMNNSVNMSNPNIISNSTNIPPNPNSVSNPISTSNPNSISNPTNIGNPNSIISDHGNATNNVVNANMTLKRKRLKSQASVDSGKLPEEEPTPEVPPPPANGAAPSAVVQSEETGERIFLRNDKKATQRAAEEEVARKEPIAFKATIVLKQTEVVGKEPRAKELLHQHSAHELLHIKNNSKEREVAERLVKSPSQGFKEAKVAPAVPRKPRVEDANEEESTGASPIIIDATSRSVKENIFNFEKRTTELITPKAALSPRRKSDALRLAAAVVVPPAKEPPAPPPAMKTSKSCPKTFEEEVDLDVETSLTAALLISDAHNQVTRFSAETPTTQLASSLFEEWEAPPPPKTAPPPPRHYKAQTLGRRGGGDPYQQEPPHFSETMTLNRMAKGPEGLFHHPHHHRPPPPQQQQPMVNHHQHQRPGYPVTMDQMTNIEISQRLLADHLQRTADPMSAQARLLDHRHVAMRAAAAPKALRPQQPPADDECLKLCQRVDQSLQLIRLQVDSLRLAAATEPEVLVPPPPSFAAVPIAPPPEFSDVQRPRRAPASAANYPYPEHRHRLVHPHQLQQQQLLQQHLAQRPPFRQRPLPQWSSRDVADWLDSLFLPEYKAVFAEAGITGSKLANMDTNDLMGLGVKQAGHRLNMERSIKWYLK